MISNKKLEKKNLMNFTQISINSDFERYKQIFLEQNSKLNLISKNEEKFLYEKHIFDSLAIKLFFDKYNIKSCNLLDIGTGGGFPSVPIAIEYPHIQVTAIDSINKKINAINNIKKELNITNLEPICDRVENLQDKKYEIITSRAVAPIAILLKYVEPILAGNGYFVAYKSKKAEEELNNAKYELKKFKIKLIDKINYTLPLEETYERTLLIFSKAI